MLTAYLHYNAYTVINNKRYQRNCCKSLYLHTCSMVALTSSLKEKATVHTSGMSADVRTHTDNINYGQYTL